MLWLITIMAETFRARERFNQPALELIVDNWGEIKLPLESKDTWVVNDQVFAPAKILAEYLRKASPQQDYSTVDVTYCSAKGADRGRQFAKGAQSLQGMCRQVRHTIAGQLYHDIDMVNAHPVIMQQYCTKQGWACPVLKAYIKEREACGNHVRQPWLHPRPRQEGRARHHERWCA